MQTDPSSVLLDHPDLVRPTAPWCAALDNLQLAILLLALPWVAGGRLRRADLERQLARLGPDLPVGPVYFQRVNRATASLLGVGSLEVRGRGRQRDLRATPEGFAALVLNLRTLRLDPTLDGSEFELKRSLVAMWNVVAERVVDLPPEIALAPDLESFFDRVDRLEVLGHRVIDDRTLGEAFDVLGLVDRQRRRVVELRDRTAGEGRAAESRARLLDASRLAPRATAAEGVGRPAGAEGIITTIRALASHAIPALRARSTLARYDAYLRYLDELTALYARELRVVDLGRFRATLGRRAG